MLPCLSITDPPFSCRYIELSNGLRALLISDFSSAGTGSEDEEGEEETEDSDEGDIQELEDQDEEPGLKRKRSEKQVGRGESSKHNADNYFSETGSLQALCSLCVCCCTRVQAAAALCIGVGSFSDPDDLPGLAHFLEHSECRLSQCGFEGSPDL